MSSGAPNNPPTILPTQIIWIFGQFRRKNIFKYDEKSFVEVVQNCSKKFPLIWLHHTNLYINLACLSVCLYPINVKTAEPIGPKFVVGPRVTPCTVWWNLKNLPLNKIRFLKILKIHEFFFLNPQRFFLQCIQSEHVHYWNRKWARSALKA